MILFKNGDKFEGTRDQQLQKLNGSGMMKFGSSNTMYKGEFLDGKFHGEGQLNQNEITLTGNWIQGNPNLKAEWNIHGPGYNYQGFINNQFQKNGSGFLKFDNNCFYRGEFKNDKYHGLGELKTQDLTYKGMFQQNIFNGQGQLTMKKLRYSGNFEMGQFGGQGQLETEIGIYSGDFKNNLKHGYGIFSFKNGDQYDGQWFEDEIQGKGKLNQWNKQFGCQLIYSGTFDKGCPEGNGILEIKIENQDALRYEGSFSECLFNGKGQIWLTSNIKAEGQFFDGSISGECNIYFNKENQKLECQLKRNQKHGQCSMKIRDIQYQGMFESNIEKINTIKFYSTYKQ